VSDHPFRCFVWAFRDGDRVIAKRDFQTEAGARAYAHRESKQPGQRVTILPIDADNNLGKQIANYTEGIDALHPSITHDTNEETNDMGKPVEKQTTKKTTEPRVVKRAKDALSVEEILGMSDRQIRMLAPERRCDLQENWEGRKDHTTGFGRDYGRFLSGQIKWPPFAWDFEMSPEDAKALRKSIRSWIGKAAGVKVANPDGGRTPAQKKPADKPAETPAQKPVEKPAAKAKPATPKKAATKKPAQKKPAAKKPAQKKGEAAA
jgi:hypothetical protein